MKIISALQIAILLATGAQLAGEDLYLFQKHFLTRNQYKAETALFQVSGKKLRSVRVNMEPPDAALHTLLDIEGGFLLQGGELQMPTEVQWMSLSNPGVFRRTSVEIQGFLPFRFYMLHRSNRQSLLLELWDPQEALGKPERRLTKILDLNTGEWNEGDSPDVITNAWITDEHKWVMDLNLRQFDRGQLVIAFEHRVYPLGPPLPVALRFGEKAVPVLILNNSRFAAVMEQSRVAVNGDTTYLLWDKERDQWDRVKVPGNSSRNVRAFGKWMTGMVEEWTGPKSFRLSPGRKANSDWHPFITIDDYLSTENIYRPGVLFLYDVARRRSYQWQTANADSEVLLIEADHVYYRVADSIYRAKILDSNIGRPELVAQGEEITGVHWAFFAPSLPPAPALP